MTLVIPSAIKYLISKQVFKTVTGKSKFTLSKNDTRCLAKVSSSD